MFYGYLMLLLIHLILLFAFVDFNNKSIRLKLGKYIRNVIAQLPSSAVFFC